MRELRGRRDDQERHRPERCRAWLGPNQPGITSPDSTKTGGAARARATATATTRARRAASDARRRRGDDGDGERRGDGGGAGGGGGRRRRRPAASCRSSTTCSTTRCPAARPRCRRCPTPEAPEVARRPACRASPKTSSTSSWAHEAARAPASIVANPVLVGAVTTLVVVVAVFLAYNANKGLPFVPTTTVKFQVANGANLLPGNEVREGGSRIGLVDDMKPVRLPDGTVGAEATMKLDRIAGDDPADSTLNLRPRSVLGLKYVELTRGKSKETFEDGEHAAGRPGRATRSSSTTSSASSTARRASAVRENLEGFGDALSGRGAEPQRRRSPTLPRFLAPRAGRARRSPTTDTSLDRFFSELGDAARIVAPVADRYAHSLRGRRRHVRGVVALPRPPAGDDPRQRADDATRHPAPSASSGRSCATPPRSAARCATPPTVMPTRAAAHRPRAARPASRSFAAHAGDQRGAAADARRARGARRRRPATIYALRGVTRLVDIVHPLIRFVGPYVTVCNYFNYAFDQPRRAHHRARPDRLLAAHAAQPVPAHRATRRDPSIGSIGARTPVQRRGRSSPARR